MGVCGLWHPVHASGLWLILAIVFALNDDNLNRRNFARGYWCGVLVAVIVAVILSIVGMVMGVSIMDGLSSYQYNYRY